MPYTYERYVREDTDGYGKAGEVEWRLRSPEGECIEVYPTRRQAVEAVDAGNKTLIGSKGTAPGPKRLYPEGQHPTVEVRAIRGERYKVRDGCGFEWLVDEADFYKEQ